ncbi:MAG: hypothetical protein EAZ48_01245 [Flavobacteriia bacterium]|nr:MAG: hypothetical protein EAZ48_01245 [Flavobacteriia bacterium]
MPSLFVELVTAVGLATESVGVAVGTLLAFIVMLKVEMVVPSVSVSCAVPELEKVTPKGVLSVDELILAPVKLHDTVVVGDILVMF